MHVCVGHEEGGGRSFITLRHRLSFHPLFFFIIPSPCSLLTSPPPSPLTFLPVLHLLFFSPPHPFPSLSASFFLFLPPGEGSPSSTQQACLFQCAPQRRMHINQAYLMMSRAPRSPRMDGGCWLPGPPHSYSSTFFFFFFFTMCVFLAVHVTHTHTHTHATMSQSAEGLIQAVQ